MPTRRPLLRTLRIMAPLLAIGLLATACSSAPGQKPAGDPVSGGTLVYATGDAEPTCLDPHVGGNYPQALVSTQYLESLVSKNSAGEIIPWLATDWTEAKDGLSWDITVRSDVNFTDGTPLNAAAVKANIDHLQDPATGSSTGYLALGKIVDTKIVDDDTIRLILN